MGTEIERKYLVRGEGWRPGPAGVPLRQGFLAQTGLATVRVRVLGEDGFLTVKGLSVGISRPEYEYAIPLEDAKRMLEELCPKPLIEKVRYFREVEGLTWEIDEFRGENTGLILAEIELASEDQHLTLPDWIGLEVSGDPRYYNVNLARVPFTRW
jgi:adenylate cyclase